MSVIGNIIIGMKVSTGQFSKGISSVASGLSGLASTINGINPVFLQYATDTLGKVTSALTDVTAASFASVDAASEQAGRIGTSVKALTGLQYAAKISGSDIETLNASLTKMNVNLAKPSKGTTSALAQIGLDAEELKQLDPTEAFKQIADGIKGVENPAEKSALAMALFGKSGTQLLTTLNSGSEEINALVSEADKLHASVSDLDAANIGRANDAMDKLAFAWQGLGNIIAAEVAPFIAEVIEASLEWLTTSVDLSEIVSEGFSWIVTAIGVVLDVVHTLRLAFLALQGGTTMAIAYMLQGFSYLAKALDWVITKVTGTESTMGDLFTHMAEDMHNLTNQMGVELEEAFNAKTPSEQLGQWFDDVRERAKKMGDGAKDSKKDVEELGDSFLELTEDIEKLESKLQLAVDTFGMGANEIELFKLAQDGATDSMLEGAKALTKQLEALEATKKMKEDADAEAKKLQEQLEGDAKNIFDQTRTPLEKFEAETKKLQNLFAEGLIDPDTLNRALEQAKAGLGDNEPKFASLAEVGSQAAREITLKALFGERKQEPMKKVEGELIAINVEGRAQTKLLRKIAEKEETLVAV